MTLRITSSKRRIILLLVPLLVLAMVPPTLAQAPSAPGGDQAWPRQFQSGNITFTVYQPQLDSWHGRDLSGRAAVSVKDTVSPEEHFGSLWFTAKTNVNRAENLVTLEDITITKGNFPATPDQADQYLQALRANAPGRWPTSRSPISRRRSPSPRLRARRSSPWW